MDIAPAVAKKRERKTELERLLAAPATFSDTRELMDLNREYDDVRKCLDLAESWEATVSAQAEAEKTVAEGGDAELVQMAKDEIAKLATDEERIRAELESALVPP